MKIGAISFTDKGAEMIEDIRKKASGCKEDNHLCILSYGDIRDQGITSKDFVKMCFNEKLPILFVGACGIAVRLVAPYIKDKLTDPAVIVMDETGGFVIPILSGHMGGANELAKILSQLTGATAVITTATDINGSFAIDEFAKETHLTIHNKEKIKNVSAKVLRGEPIRISIEDFPPRRDCDVIIADKQQQVDGLWLSKKHYGLGIGCKKGKSSKDIENLVRKALAKCNIEFSDINAFASIDLKKDEPGLIDFSRKHRLPFVTFSGDMLMKAEGDFTSSEFVKETTGVDNVCERAAVLLTANKGELVLAKMAENGVTVAIARR